MEVADQVHVQPTQAASQPKEQRSCSKPCNDVATLPLLCKLALQLYRKGTNVGICAGRAGMLTLTSVLCVLCALWSKGSPSKWCHVHSRQGAGCMHSQRCKQTAASMHTCTGHKLPQDSSTCWLHNPIVVCATIIDRLVKYSASPGNLLTYTLCYIVTKPPHPTPSVGRNLMLPSKYTRTLPADTTCQPTMHCSMANSQLSQLL